MKNEKLTGIEMVEYELIYCPVLKKKIDPCKCYETLMGRYNVLESVGILGDDAWKKCEEVCDKIPEFIEKQTSYVVLNNKSQIISKTIIEGFKNPK
jgi:hypothetical protein